MLCKIQLLHFIHEEWIFKSCSRFIIWIVPDHFKLFNLNNLNYLGKMHGTSVRWTQTFSVKKMKPIFFRKFWTQKNETNPWTGRSTWTSLASKKQSSQHFPHCSNLFMIKYISLIDTCVLPVHSTIFPGVLPALYPSARVLHFSHTFNFNPTTPSYTITMRSNQ